MARAAGADFTARKPPSSLTDGFRRGKYKLSDVPM
jgi:hypothetical protein